VDFAGGSRENSRGFTTGNIPTYKKRTIPNAGNRRKGAREAQRGTGVRAGAARTTAQVSKVDQIKVLLEECSPDEQKAFLNYLKARFPHPLEKEWGVSSDIILSAIARSPDLTRKGVRGIIAEAIFAERIVAPLVTVGWGVVHFVGDQPYDFLISNGGVNIRIQVKLQRLEKGIPKIASKRRYPGEKDFYIVEVQKTRTGKDATTQEDTRPYRFGEFDILAVSMHPSTKDWSKFLFTVGDWLLPRVENDALIEIMQPVPQEPNDVWTDSLHVAIKWLTAKDKKRIFDVNPALFRPRKRKPK